MTVEERIERLERNNRLLLAGLVAAILMGFVAIISTSSRGAVIARQFVLEDDNGIYRAMLEMLDGGPMLRLFDANKKPRASLAVSEDGTMSILGMFDENGKSRLALTASDVGQALILFDANGKPAWKTP